MRTALNLGGLGLGLALLTALASWAQEAPAARVRGGPGARLLAGAGDETFHSGFVLVEGKYVPPPYVIRGTDGALLAGGVAVAAPAGRGPRRGERAESDLKRMLRGDACFVVLPGEPIVMLSAFPAGAAFLSLLVPGADRNTAVSNLKRHSAPEVWSVLWRERVLRFQAAADFQVRAQRVIDQNSRRQAVQRAQEAADDRLRTAEFPLLSCALLLAALAGWHLLRNVPSTSAGGPGAEASPSLAMRQSLLLVLALAALDGVWTLLAAQAGQLREMNPLAARLLDQPDALLAFKIACTVGPAALIYTLRRHRAAQLAAWWMCFITTLVACRWVVQTAT